MKRAILLFSVLVTGGFHPVLTGSESAPDCEAAVDILKAGIEIHPDQAAVLFQDALQTNPGCRRQLFLAAIEITGKDPEVLTQLIYIARLEFPEDDTLFAETAISVAPEWSAEIRNAFMGVPESPEEMPAALSAVDSLVGNEREPSSEGRRVDAEVRDAIARMRARKEGKFWPEQELSEEPLQFRKADEIRISKKFRDADETSLTSSLPLDREDEREFSPEPVSIDDFYKPSDQLRLDESKFTAMGRSASTEPLEAGSRAISPSGAVAPLPETSVSSTAPFPENSAGVEEDRQEEETWRAPLLFRPEPALPTLPR